MCICISIDFFMHACSLDILKLEWVYLTFSIKSQACWGPKEPQKQYERDVWTSCSLVSHLDKGCFSKLGGWALVLLHHLGFIFWDWTLFGCISSRKLNFFILQGHTWQGLASLSPSSYPDFEWKWFKIFILYKMENDKNLFDGNIWIWTIGLIK